MYGTITSNYNLYNMISKLKKLFQRVEKHYTDPRLVELYDIENPWSDDSDFYVSIIDNNKKRILDIGCGTGVISIALAEKGHTVTALDPSFAMIDAAKQKKNASLVYWVVSPAQSYHDASLYDIAIMTGHTFQNLLTVTDVTSTLNMIYRQLSVGGKLIFESRNPLIDWHKKWSQLPERHITHNNESIVVTTDSVNTDGEYISFKHHYAIAHQTLTSESTLRFMNKEKIEDLLLSNSFQIETVYGDWDMSPYTNESKEMIFVAKK
jgi:2-polyprenyl-3-methyl-5-hydroxy-6-metoxy-1,4-benzoquinol methylase